MARVRRLVTLFTVVGLGLGLAAAVSCASSAPKPAQHALVLVDKGQTDAAIALLEAHLRQHPSALLERRLALRLYGVKGDLGRARLHADELVNRLGVRDPTPWLDLGHAHELSHRFEDALAHYDRAAAIAPQDPAGPRTGGLRAAAWGELEHAEPRLSEAARRQPSHAPTWHALAVVRVKLRQLERAEEAYRRGLLADPASLDNRIGLATLGLLRDQPQVVLSEYEAVLRSRPEFADAHLGRSWALARLGRYTEALAALDEATRRGANPTHVERQRRWLAELSKSATSR